MSNQSPAAPALRPIEPAPMRVVLEAADDFAPRTRKSTADSLTALRPSLDAVQANPGKIYTIARDLTPKASASLVGLLNEHNSHDWTFAARTTDDGTAIVQAKFDPANRRKVRTVVRKPKTAKPVAPKAGK